MAKWCASFREFSSMGSSLKELVLTRRPANWSRLDQRLKQFCCLSILELVPSQPYHIWNIHFCLVRPPRCCMSQCQWSTSTRSTRPLVGITSCTRARSTGGQFLLMGFNKQLCWSNSVGFLFSLVLNYYRYYIITRKPGRTEINYIGSIDFESDTNPKHWAMRGVALLCDIK